MGGVWSVELHKLREWNWMKIKVWERKKGMARYQAFSRHTLFQVHQLYLIQTVSNNHIKAKQNNLQNNVMKF